MRNKEKKAAPDIQDCRDGKGRRESIDWHQTYLWGTGDKKLKSLKEEASLLQCWATNAIILNWQALQMRSWHVSVGSWHVSTCSIQTPASLRDPVSLSTEYCFPQPFKQQTPASRRVLFSPVFFNSLQVTAFKFAWTRPWHPRFSGTRRRAGSCRHRPTRSRRAGSAASPARRQRERGTAGRRPGEADPGPARLAPAGGAAPAGAPGHGVTGARGHWDTRDIGGHGHTGTRGTPGPRAARAFPHRFSLHRPCPRPSSTPCHPPEEEYDYHSETVLKIKGKPTSG